MGMGGRWVANDDAILFFGWTMRHAAPTRPASIYCAYLRAYLPSTYLLNPPKTPYYFCFLLPFRFKDMMAAIVNAVREEVVVTTSRASAGGVASSSTLSSSATLAARVGAEEAFAGASKYTLCRTITKWIVH